MVLSYNQLLAPGRLYRNHTGSSLALSVNCYNSIKLFVSSGISTRTRTNYDALVIAGNIDGAAVFKIVVMFIRYIYLTDADRLRRCYAKEHLVVKCFSIKSARFT